MDPKLFARAMTGFFCGLVLTGLLLFLPAGTFAYPQAWLLMGILFIPMFIAGLVMMKRSPGLLRKRLSVKEEQPEQKAVIDAGLLYADGDVAGAADRLRESGVDPDTLPEELRVLLEQSSQA